VNFGEPYFSPSGVPLAVVWGRMQAGESPAETAEDFDIPLDQVVEVHRLSC
jgi:uncharacterized protein (DUF433 family)